VNIDLSTDTPASPVRTLQLAEAFAEIARVLNHTTADHAAFGVPANADRVLWEYITAVERMPQFLSQLARWVALEDGAGRVASPSGDPHTAVAALQDLGDVARMSAGILRADLLAVAQVTSTLAEADPEEDGADDA
jgi:hypothetical protein